MPDPTIAFLSSPLMTVSLNGIPCPRVGRSSTLSNYVSADFVSRYFPSRSSSSFFLVTLNSPGRGTFTTQLAFTVDHHLFVDVALGLQWKAFVADWLSDRGETVPPAFDPFSHVLGLTSVPVFLAPRIFAFGICSCSAAIGFLLSICAYWSAFGTCRAFAAIRFRLSVCAYRFAFGTCSAPAAVRFRLSVCAYCTAVSFRGSIFIFC
ncbi:hypothetical protein MVEN_01985400 [Mycena venus]|uniref:Uncharacterized protein n=1 Tax=Mycena venus TaxID=2733690 RepID=A0A8H6XD05_9AGAR|nr:hypothetical protein MVEN_01985400 [Mycena venus]